MGKSVLPVYVTVDSQAATESSLNVGGMDTKFASDGAANFNLNENTSTGCTIRLKFSQNDQASTDFVFSLTYKEVTVGYNSVEIVPTSPNFYSLKGKVEEATIYRADKKDAVTDQGHTSIIRSTPNIKTFTYVSTNADATTKLYPVMQLTFVYVSPEKKQKLYIIASKGFVQQDAWV
jgi:hypothetical protein